MDTRPLLRALCLACAALAGFIGAVSLVSDDPTPESAPTPVASSHPPAQAPFPIPIPFPASGSPDPGSPAATDDAPPSAADLDPAPWTPDDPPRDGPGS